MHPPFRTLLQLCALRSASAHPAVPAAVIARSFAAYQQGAAGPSAATTRQLAKSLAGQEDGTGHSFGLGSGVFSALECIASSRGGIQGPVLVLILGIPIILIICAILVMRWSRSGSKPQAQNAERPERLSSGSSPPSSTPLVPRQSFQAQVQLHASNAKSFLDKRMAFILGPPERPSYDPTEDYDALCPALVSSRQEHFMIHGTIMPYSQNGVVELRKEGNVVVRALFSELGDPRTCAVVIETSPWNSIALLHTDKATVAKDADPPGGPRFVRVCRANHGANPTGDGFAVVEPIAEGHYKNFVMWHTTMDGRPGPVMLKMVRNSKGVTVHAGDGIDVLATYHAADRNGATALQVVGGVDVAIVFSAVIAVEKLSYGGPKLAWSMYE